MKSGSFVRFTSLGITVLAFILILPLAVSTTGTQKQSRRASQVADDAATSTISSPDKKFSKKADSKQTALGYNAFTGIQISQTWYDIHSNGTIGRKIVRGSDGRVHFVWMQQNSPSGDRTVQYGSWTATGGLSLDGDISLATGGFPTISIDAVRAVPAWHVNSSDIIAGQDFASGAAAFTTAQAPPPPNCQLISTGLSEETYLWPYVAYDDFGANDVVHVVATERTPTVNEMRSLVYYRGTGAVFTNFGSCARFIDSVTAISATVVENPNTQDAAIVWLHPKHYNPVPSQYDNDLMIMTSSNQGATWGPPLNVTNYPSPIGPGQRQRAFYNLDALYTNDNCLHVVWDVAQYSPTNDGIGSVDPQLAQLYHWNSCSGNTKLVTEQFDKQPCAPGVYNLNISKPSLSECLIGANRRLYVTYSRFQKSGASFDCSTGGYANGELFVQSSTNGGSSWGKPFNASGYSGSLPAPGTPTPNCNAGACQSEQWASQAMYVQDTLRILYIGDSDPGAYASGSPGQGSQSLANVMYQRIPCYASTAFRLIRVDHKDFGYPLRVNPSLTKDTTLVLRNIGNDPALYTTSIVYNSGAGWLSILGGASGTVPAGAIDTSFMTIRFTGPPVEGFYSATLRINYNDGTSNVNLDVPIEMYCYNNFFIPQLEELLTSADIIMRVSQTACTEYWPGGGATSKRFRYTSEGLDYLNQGALIIGNSAANLSSSFMNGFPDLVHDAPEQGGALRPMYALSALAVDSLSSPNYIIASGKSCNHDSTIAFLVQWYAPKNPDSANFYVLHGKTFKGPKNPGGTVTGLALGFISDWDIPGTNGTVENSVGHDSLRGLVYFQGIGDGSARFGGSAAAIVDLSDLSSIAGAFELDASGHVIWDETSHIDDTLWNRMINTTGFDADPSIENPLSVSVLKRDFSIGPSDTLEFLVILAGQQNGSVMGLKSAVDAGYQFACDYATAGRDACLPCYCGDADGNGIITISDVVYLINYIFAGGPAPYPLCSGDADGNGILTISDAVYLINFIFAGGSPPHCP